MVKAAVDKKPVNDDLSQKLFVGTMLGMSWQMAIAVLIPTVGGYKLDDYFHTSPKLTLLGLSIAVVASVLIIRNAIKSLNIYMTPEIEETKENNLK